jgi:hypothetical protein
MCRRDDSGVKSVRENVRAAAVGQVAIEALHVGEAATEHDDLRVEYVEDAGQGTA